MKPNEIPIKSSWPSPLGPVLTDSRITKRARQGWYGRIMQLRAHLKSTKKDERKKAKEELKRYEGLPVKRGRRTTVPINIEEFC